MPARARVSMRLDISRPVLMTHVAPSACNSANNSKRLRGIGGFSNSENRVPSKSVEIDLMDTLIGYGAVRLTCLIVGCCLRFGCQKFMSTHQDRYDDAMFDFSTGNYRSEERRVGKECR